MSDGRPDATDGPLSEGFDPDGDGEDIEPMSFRQRTARLAAIVGVLLIMAIWGWALFGPHPTKMPGTLADPAFATTGEAICTDAAGELALLPRGYMTTDHAERAAVVRRSDVILTAMLDRLDAAAPDDGTADADMIAEWLGDWRTYVGDRENYATALSSDPMARFYVSVKEKRQVTVPVDFFANANKMYNCVTPDDIE